MKFLPPTPSASSARMKGRRLWAATTLVQAAAICLLSSSCVGIRTAGEKDERVRAQAVVAKYRGAGGAPVVPVLRSGGSPESFMLHAMMRHPQVEAACYEWLAAVEKITRERSLPDPQVTFQTDIARIVMTVMPGLMMGFPGPGKLRAAADVATAESRMKYQQFVSAVLQVAYRFKKSWYELRLVDERIRVNREIITLLEDLEKLAQSRLEAGKGSLQDLLRIQMEKERLQTDLVNLRDSRGWYLTQFKAALGLGPGERTPPLPRVLASSSLKLGGDEVLAVAMERNPQLKSLEEDVRRAEAAVVAAWRVRIPDFSLGAMVDVNAAPTMVRPLAGMTLPVWRDKIAAEVQGARALAGGAKARLDSERLNLAVDAAMKSYQYRESTRLLALLDGSLLPKARQALEVARSGYATGGTDFINLIDAQRTLLNFRLGEVEARIKRELALAELSLIVMGVPPSGAPVLSVEKNRR